MEITILVRRDEEAGVWIGESDDVPGMVLEEKTIEGIVDGAREVIPELLRLNAERKKKRTSRKPKAVWSCMAQFEIAA